MRGRSLIFVAIIGPTGALAQDSALDAITHEQTDLRAENRKAFALSDFTNLAAFYGSPMHELEGGVWVDLTDDEKSAPPPSGKIAADFTGFEGHGGTPVPSGEIVGYRAAIIPCLKTPLDR